MLETTARSAHCQRCTNCSRQYCTADYIHDSTLIPEFETKKGTKQLDPLSSLLFNMVLQKALEDDIPRWQKKQGMGIYLSDNDHDCLTNLRLADDVLLFASSQKQLQKMLCEFKQKY